MSKLENSIGWCDDTGNKVIGCDKASPGCKNCYAEIGTIARVMRSRAVNPVETWGPKGTRIPVGDFTAKLKRLNRLCICDKCHETQPAERVGQECGMLPKGVYLADLECTGRLRHIRLFADSNSDWLDARWGAPVLAEFLVEICAAPNVDVLLLTKRLDRFSKAMRDVVILADQNGMSQAAIIADNWTSGKPPANVWLGASVENQECADDRILDLLCTPAAIRFLSCEPLLEDVDIQSALGRNIGCNDAMADKDCVECAHLAKPVDWIIVGGESGKHRRDCGIGELRDVIRQVTDAGVPVYVKQDCAFKSGQQGRIPDEAWRLKQFPETNIQHSTPNT